MITQQHLQQIEQILTNDESFCRLLCYGSDPMNAAKDDITLSDKKEEYLKDIIWFSPQTDDLATEEKNRILIYKSKTSLKHQNILIRKDFIMIDLYVPHRLVKEDFRIYSLENIISSLLDRRAILSIDSLNYEDGHFLDSTVKGFALFRMVFTVKQGRDIGDGQY